MPHPQFFRPAAIEIRFSDKNEYNDAAKHYNEALNQVPNHPIPTLPNSLPFSISFPVGPPTQGGGNAKHSMELSLSYISSVANGVSSDYSYTGGRDNPACALQAGLVIRIGLYRCRR